jgi:hypothetical protein
MTASCDPLAIWRKRADDVTGQAVDSGHFVPEERPAETPAALRRFHAVTESTGRRRERLRRLSRPSARVPVDPVIRTPEQRLWVFVSSTFDDG